MPVNYPDLSNLTTTGEIGDLFALPNASYPFYWGLILVAIWVVVSFTIYFKEKSLKATGNLLSAMAVSAFACIMLGTIGTLIGIITLPIFLPLLIAGLTIIAIWIFSGK